MLWVPSGALRKQNFTRTKVVLGFGYMYLVIICRYTLAHLHPGLFKDFRHYFFVNTIHICQLQLFYHFQSSSFVLLKGILICINFYNSYLCRVFLLIHRESCRGFERIVLNTFACVLETFFSIRSATCIN
ncbi:hypothetical protein A8C56_21370 [Niabella ginsenosidivorans]|uniref:Uncharacterized protein n=1 Tax=Niabella ginsenosidivorans TaxID=1176587 RepID=A0A1A9I904_9BACT|nr:hypothetical protein A8C56_21370 [Niabella ginsenosidivorans]